MLNLVVDHCCFSRGFVPNDPNALRKIDGIIDFPKSQVIFSSKWSQTYCMSKNQPQKCLWELENQWGSRTVHICTVHMDELSNIIPNLRPHRKGLIVKMTIVLRKKKFLAGKMDLIKNVYKNFVLTETAHCLYIFWFKIPVTDITWLFFIRVSISWYWEHVILAGKEQLGAWYEINVSPLYLFAMCINHLNCQTAQFFFFRTWSSEFLKNKPFTCKTFTRFLLSI